MPQASTGNRFKRKPLREPTVFEHLAKVGLLLDLLPRVKDSHSLQPHKHTLTWGFIW